MPKNNEAENRITIGQRVLNVIGVKGTFKESVVPMMNYCYVNIFLGGGGYLISQYFLAFLTDVVHFDIKVATAISTIAVFWDAITDPVMGIISDRTRSKTGKHRRYLLWGIPFLLISYSMLWNSAGMDAEQAPIKCFVYYTFSYMLYKTAYTIISIPHTAMLPELAPEYNQRTQYTSVSYIFNSCGMIPSYIVFLILCSVFGASQELDSSSKQPFLWSGIILSVFYSVAVFATYKTVREPSSLDNKNEPFDFKLFISEYRLVLKSRAFRQYFFMNFFWQISTGFFSTTKIYYIKYLANQYSVAKYAILNTVAGVFETAAFPLNYALTMKFGKKKCGTIVTPFMIIGLAIGLFMKTSQENTALSKVMFILLILSQVFYPFGMSGLGFVSNNVFPDLTDVDELITGRRREGVISTFSTFIKKSVNSAMISVVGLILGFFGLVTGSEVELYEKVNKAIYPQPESAMTGIRLCIAFIPIISAIASWYLLKKFQMTKDDHTMIRAAIATKRKFGSVTLSDYEKERIEIVTGQKLSETWLGEDNDETQGHTLDKNENGEYLIILELEEQKKLQNKTI